jgi:phenylacetate-CoA ligase
MITKKILLKSSLLFSQRDYEREYKKIVSGKTHFENDLKNLLLYAAKHVPYWKERLSSFGVVKNNKVDLSKFQEIPILTREIIHNNFNDLCSDELKKRKAYLNMTGGSTGKPVRFFQDVEYRKWRHATNAYYYRNILKIDEKNTKKLFLWGSERDLFKGGMGIKQNIKSWLQNSVFLNCFKMDKEEMKKYVKIINNFKPDVVRGYTGALYELARFVQENKIYLYKPQVVIAAAENVTDSMREMIEKAFGTKLYNFYGSREVSAIAGECREGFLHVFSFFNHVEVVREKLSEAREGRVLITNLRNYSMPFIRYDIGDLAEMGPANCPCGNSLPILNKIKGRVTEHLRTKEGKFVSGVYFIHLIGVVCNRGAIRQFQVVQEEYDFIRILVVAGKEFKEEDREDINEKIRFVMGKDCKIKWENVKEIPKTKSGKYIYIKSLVEN